MKRSAVWPLALGVLVISWGSPLARLTAAAPLAVAAWRMTLAAAALLSFRAFTGAPLLPPRHRAATVLAGVFLGLHFGTWIPSLWLTTVSASVVLVTTAPLFVLLASPRCLGVPITARNVASLVVAVSGVAVIAGGDFSLSPRAFAGDVLALAGAVCMAGYLVIGKRLRGEVPLGGYLGTVYGVAATILMLAVVLGGVSPWPENRISWLPLLGMALGPTLVGHSTLNWALAHLQAYQVNLSVLLEPVLASFWAWLVLAEVPPLHVLPGAALVLAALVLEFLPRRAPAPAGEGQSGEGEPPGGGSLTGRRG